VTEPEKIEVAWLVELGPACVQTPHYLFVSESDMEWTEDVNSALRFSRKIDAQEIIRHFGWTEATAVEHIWS